MTGYFATYGSDTPPTCYDDIDDADFITFWGHNAREAHPVLFWRYVVAAIKSVEPGGHFFGTGHTLERFETAFYQPMVSDWRNFEQWTAAGAPEAKDHAHALWKQALAEYEEPPMDPAIREEIETFVERRIAEGGSPTDF